MDPLLPFLIFALLCSFGTSSAEAVPGNESDRNALLDFKTLITQDPSQILSSWNDSTHFCNWVGVSCDPSNGRVQVLNLQSLKLIGSLPPSLGNLSFLTGINLRTNSFTGRVPEELGRLPLLRHLNLSFNSFTGNIPSNLSKELTVLSLARNGFSGDIPDHLGLNSKLVWLDLGFNNFTGIVPRWIGNLSSTLVVFSVGPNRLTGTVPGELGMLSKLGFFQLFGNFLTGTIPSAIYNISSLYFFAVAQNQLHGQLPPDVGLKLPNLRTFSGGVNSFTGRIPVSLANATGLQIVDFAENGLTGEVPESLATLQSLSRINFDLNRLGYMRNNGMDFLTSLVNCTSLEVLGMGYNNFGGTLPSSVANLSTQLKILTLGANHLTGSIPVRIGNLVNLSILGLEGNFLTGSVPDSIGRLQQLEGLNLNVNRLTGRIPDSIGNLTRLTRLFMEVNRLEGSIPPSLGSCQNLQNLNLSSNNLNGTIPKEVFRIPSLSISLVLSSNHLTGPIPLQVGNLNNLMNLDLSGNDLSGEIPGTIGSCISLEYLSLQGNSFQGRIPVSLRALRGVRSLDLSSNNLSGRIPEFLSSFTSLYSLNLSHNNFTGQVPTKGVFANFTALSIAGNPGICGGVQELHLPSCIQEMQQQHTKSLNLKIVIPAIVIAILAAVLATYLAMLLVKRSRKERSSEAQGRQGSLPPDQDWQNGVSYLELRRSTNGFAAENLIGSGSFGTVYKGVLSDVGRMVAIKVLNLQQHGASKSFVDECNALKNVRHRNLVKILNVCSTTDPRGNSFKAIIFEFMSNGSLEDWLHPHNNNEDTQKGLIFTQRLNIAIDVANALNYLHHQCETPIAHCDLKPSNILLDQDLTAHVGDFGLASFLFESSKAETVSVSLKGSIGYIPPEYGHGSRVSVVGDVYSFGILLLEMFTGKRPTEEMFKDDMSIHRFVAMALPDGVMDVVDKSMLVDDDEFVSPESEQEKRGREDEEAMMRDAGASGLQKIEECLAGVLKVGLACSVTSPANRMSMSFAVNKLNDIRTSFQR
ncbi:Probable LRR receptor-like serine/threonine-protein kinase At3g47570 [Linum perenne]